VTTTGATQATAPTAGRSEQWELRFRRVSLIASALVSALGATVLVGGWGLGITGLKHIFPRFETMKANTAALFLLLGLGLLRTNRTTSHARVRIEAILGLVVMVVALFTLAEYVFHTDLGVDQILARDASPLRHPGRMAPATSVNFVLLGFALSVRDGGWRFRVSEVAALLAATTALTALYGYLYGVPALYAVGYYASISLHTTIAFLLACAAFLLGSPERGFVGLLASDTDAGRLLRPLLPAIMFGPMIIGWLRLRGEKAGYYDMPFGLALMTLSTVMLLGLFTSVLAASLRRTELNRRVAVLELIEGGRRFHAQLRKVVEERTRELALAKETLDGIIAIAADAIVTMDEDQRITIFNRGAENVFGWARDEVLGKPLDVLIAESFRDAHHAYLTAFAKEPTKTTKMADRRTVFGKRKNGEEFPAEATISKLEMGSQRLITVILRDITEQQRFAAQQSIFVRVGEILEATISVDDLAKELAEAVVPVLGDVCEIEVVQDGGPRAQVRYATPESAPVVESLRLPLLAHGRRLGTISLHTRDARRDYARDAKVIEEVAHRFALALDGAFLRERHQLEAEITTHLGEGVVLIRSTDGTIVYTNRQFERMFGYPPRGLLGKHASVLNAPGALSPEPRAEEIMAELRRSGSWRGEIENCRQDGSSLWCYASVASCEHPQFGPVWIAVHADITETKRLEQDRARRYEERATLLKEIHHRVKNNLQVIASLFYLQRERTSEEPLRKLLDESRNRIQAIALVHEKLYRAEHLAWIDFGDYLRSLASTVSGAIGVPASQVRIDVHAENVTLDIDRAIPCALIVNELVSNALKHAFPGRRCGEVRIDATRAEPRAMDLDVSDDGVGFPADLDFTATTTLGMQLVVSLAKQLRGTVQLEREGGTRFHLRFPVSA
jgi:PAS domain S-box-containing protein